MILYLGYASFVPDQSRVPAVPDHVCRRDRPVPRLRCGDLHTHDDLAAARRRDLARAACRVRSRSRWSCSSSRAPATTVAFFPREAVTGVGRSGRADADAGSDAPSSSAGMSSQPRVPLVIPADGAKVLIVKFNDFQCPACGQTYLQYKPMLAKYRRSDPGAVKMVLKDYPLNRDCNDEPAADAPPGRVRRGGGGAPRARAQQGRGDGGVALHAPEEHDAAGRPPGGARGRAASPTSTRSTPRRSSWSRATSRSAASWAIKSTPTFFINGVKIEGALPPQYFDQAIAYELQPARRTDVTARAGHPRAHEGLRGRLLAEAPLPRARSPDARGRAPARSSAFSAPTAPARPPR